MVNFDIFKNNFLFSHKKLSNVLNILYESSTSLIITEKQSNRVKQRDKKVDRFKTYK